MNPIKKFFTILHSQFNYHTLAVTPFNEYIGVSHKNHSPIDIYGSPMKGYSHRTLLMMALRVVDKNIGFSGKNTGLSDEITVGFSNKKRSPMKLWGSLKKGGLRRMSLKMTL